MKTVISLRIWQKIQDGGIWYTEYEKVETLSLYAASLLGPQQFSNATLFDIYLICLFLQTHLSFQAKIYDEKRNIITAVIKKTQKRSKEMNCSSC